MRIRESAIGEPILAKLTLLAASDERHAEHYARLAEVVETLEGLPPDESIGAEIIERRPPALLIVGRAGRAVTVRPDRHDSPANAASTLHFRLRIDRGENEISDELRITEPVAAADRIADLLSSDLR